MARDNGGPTLDGGDKPRLRHPRKSPKRCAIGCYHVGAVLLLVGIVVGLVGLCSDSLFEILVYDNRHPPLFHHISVNVGLFVIKGTVKGSNNSSNTLEHPPILDGTSSFYRLFVCLFVYSK